MPYRYIHTASWMDDTHLLTGDWQGEFELWHISTKNEVTSLGNPIPGDRVEADLNQKTCGFIYKIPELGILIVSRQESQLELYKWVDKRLKLLQIKSLEPHTQGVRSATVISPETICLGHKTGYLSCWAYSDTDINLIETVSIPGYQHDDTVPYQIDTNLCRQRVDINNLILLDNSHLIAASEEGKIYLVNLQQFQVKSSVQITFSKASLHKGLGINAMYYVPPYLAVTTCIPHKSVPHLLMYDLSFLRENYYANDFKTLANYLVYDGVHLTDNPTQTYAHQVVMSEEKVGENREFAVLLSTGEGAIWRGALQRGTADTGVAVNLNLLKKMDADGAPIFADHPGFTGSTSSQKKTGRKLAVAHGHTVEIVNHLP